MAGLFYFGFRMFDFGISWKKSEIPHSKSKIQYIFAE